jgi:uncharacterized iron-regulated protein
MRKDSRPPRAARARKMRCVIGSLAAVTATAFSGPVLACAPSAFDNDLAVCAGAVGHPLCGRVYATRSQKLLEPASNDCPLERSQGLTGAISAAIKANGIVILGEVHDNPLHHKLRSSLLMPGAPVVFEQMRADLQPQIAAFMEKSDGHGTAEAFKRAVGWADLGWDQTSYDPIFAEVLRAKLPIYAGDAPRAKMMALVKQGAEAVAASDQERLALSRPQSDSLSKASLVEIEEAHCGMLPKEVLPGMAIAQRYRDAHLADVTLAAVLKHGSAILITGNNHARTDRGVPWYIAAREPQRPVLSVMFVAAVPEQTAIEDYVPRAPDGAPAADFIVLTAPVIRDSNPCDAFRKKAPA